MRLRLGRSRVWFEKNQFVDYELESGYKVFCWYCQSELDWVWYSMIPGKLDLLLYFSRRHSYDLRNGLVCSPTPKFTVPLVDRKMCCLQMESNLGLP